MPTILRMESELHQWFSEYHPYISQHYSITQLRNKRHQLSQKFPHLAHNLTLIREKSWSELAQEMKYESQQKDNFITNAREIYIRERNRVSLYTDVLPTLQALKKHYQLAAVTNGNADIRKIGLTHLLDFCWSAADAGQSKPHPIVFESLMQKYQFNCSEIVHIGDDPITDICGAQTLGIRAIWLNRTGQSWPDTLNPPFAEIDQLNQLPALIKLL